MWEAIIRTKEYQKRLENCLQEELERLKKEKKQPVSREQFMEHMELESIQVEPDGVFEFWFGDGDLFYGHSIHVAGDVKEGPDWAQIEG